MDEGDESVRLPAAELCRQPYDGRHRALSVQPFAYGFEEGFQTVGRVRMVEEDLRPRVLVRRRPVHDMGQDRGELLVARGAGEDVWTWLAGLEYALWHGAAL